MVKAYFVRHPDFNTEKSSSNFDLKIIKNPEFISNGILNYELIKGEYESGVMHIFKIELIYSPCLLIYDDKIYGLSSILKKNKNNKERLIQIGDEFN